MDSTGVCMYPRWFKILVSAFILFHWICVIGWLLPKPSPVKTFLLTRTIPLLTRSTQPDGSRGKWTFRRRPIASTYLFHTAQWQDWQMFAPDPLQINRYVAATVTFQNGATRLYTFPRLSQLNWLEAWVEKRYRKLQHRIAENKSPLVKQDLARFIARRTHDPANPPIRVVLTLYEAPIPRHDRPEVSGPAPAWVDYTRLLRQEARTSETKLLDYRVQPEDLQ